LVLDFLSEEPSPALKKAVEARLAVFERHKDTLLDHLRKSKHDPKSQPRDTTEWWPQLTRLAQLYFLQQLMTPTSERVARLHKLAKVLERALVLATKAAQDDLGCDYLLSTLFRGALPRDPGGMLVRDEGGSFRAEYFPPLKQIVANLRFYQAAVLRAADDVPVVERKPSILPQDYISILADVYRTSTGREPGAGHGPFTRFLMKFRAALDPSSKASLNNGDEYVDDSLIEAVKSIRRKRGRL
jgi:hypothetical protein